MTHYPGVRISLCNKLWFAKCPLNSFKDSILTELEEEVGDKLRRISKMGPTNPKGFTLKGCSKGHDNSSVASRGMAHESDNGSEQATDVDSDGAPEARGSTTHRATGVEGTHPDPE
ncbi:hypothetical protein AAMO2058_000125800 [Amorphochlora amoebiformis]